MVYSSNFQGLLGATGSLSRNLTKLIVLTVPVESTDPDGVINRTLSSPQGDAGCLSINLTKLHDLTVPFWKHIPCTHMVCSSNSL
jgi:hypothetical protein